MEETRLVIVRDFDVVGIAAPPGETDAILLIDTDAVLATAIARQPLEPIAGGHGKLPEIAHPIELGELPSGRRP